MRFVLPPKENGERLVGQCEISHPVPPRPSGSADDVASPALHVQLASPVDELDPNVSPRVNVLFEADSKGEYEPLDARISSESGTPRCAA